MTLTIMISYTSLIQSTADFQFLSDMVFFSRVTRSFKSFSESIETSDGSDSKSGSLVRRGKL